MLTIEQWHLRYLEQASWSFELRQYVHQKINIDQCASILEIGCGTGAVLQEYTNSEQKKQVIGLDLDISSLKYCKRQSPEMELISGNVYSLPLRANSIDFAFCHYLLLWLGKPENALSELLRVVKPGGWIVAMAEPDHAGRVDWPNPLDALGNNQTKALINQGVDPMMGRKLADCFVNAGIQLMDAGITGGQWGPKRKDIKSSMEWDVLQADLNIDPDELKKYQEIDSDAKANGFRVEFIPTFYAIGKKPL
jgi:SAM-dependent methyltransferase